MLNNNLNPSRIVGTFLVCSLLLSCLLLSETRARAAARAAEQTQSSELRDGQHDFDFHFGTWHTHIRRLVHPLTGSTTWVELDGTVTVRKIWGGRANLEEIEAGNATTHFKGLTLFLYNPQAHQWSQTFANINDGTLGTPLIGEFKNGRGEFLDQEVFNERMILVRFVWSDIAPDSHHVEQSFSEDDGRTWEPNFMATLTRENDPPNSDQSFSAPASESPDVSHDFDFNFGVWKTHIRRLQHPLTGSNSWVDYDGTSTVNEIWGGRGSLFELEATGPTGHIEGMGLRLYNPKSHQWSLNWANSTDGVMTTPMVGSFDHGQGHFYDQEELQGRIIMVRNGFSSITPDSSRFEQAFSDDQEKTWETNWIMTFTR